MAKLSPCIEKYFTYLLPLLMKYFSTLKEKLPISMWPCTVEPQYDEPLHNKLLGIMNNFLFPSNGKTYE